MLDEDVVAVVAGAVAELLVLQQMAEDLGKVGLARPKEAGDPHSDHITRSATASDGLADLGERIEDALEFFFDLVSDNVLTNLGGERRLIEDLDDAFDLLADVPLDDFLDCSHSDLLLPCLLPIIARTV